MDKNVILGIVLVGLIIIILILSTLLPSLIDQVDKIKDPINTIKISQSKRFISFSKIRLLDNYNKAIPIIGTASISTYIGYMPKFGINDNQDDILSNKSDIITKMAGDEWWQVELKFPISKKTIKFVEIYNRTDCCWDMLNGAKLELLQKDTPLFTTTLNSDLVQKIPVS